jgi:hypothetical protein
MKLISFLLTICSLSASAQLLEKGFRTPPDSTKPSVYWYWMSDNISEDGVRKDVEAMAAVGIGRAFIGNIGYDPREVPYGKVKLFSPEWWKITKTAIQTANRKGITIGLFNSPGWSQSGGPWVLPAESMQYLAYDEQEVAGPREVVFPRPAGAIRPVAAVAFPTAHGQVLPEAILTASSGWENLPALTDENPETASFFPAGQKEDLVLDLAYKQAFTARSLTLVPAPVPVRFTGILQVKEADGSFRTLREFDFDRSNPDDGVGFRPYAPVVLAIPDVSGSAFRLIIRHIRGKGGLAECRISPEARLERFEEKQLAKMFQTPLPLWNEYQWVTQPEPKGEGQVLDPARMIKLPLEADGSLRWAAPAGKWTIVWFGTRSTGRTNSPASPEGKGLEVDKMNRKNLRHHFDSFIGAIYDSLAPADRKALRYVVADSYETGSQNWTDGMAEAFQQRYGYDPLPWLPVFSGRIVGSADRSDRFLWDVRRLVADRVAYEYVGGLRNLSHTKGMKLWLENYGHWGFPGEFLQYGGQSDEVGGEFWNEGDLGSIENRAAASAAHIYGKNKVAAESFTAGGKAFVRYPALLKKRGDWSFTEGVNHTLLHVMITQPTATLPGVNAGFGTEFNRHNTWFYQSKAFVDYLRRCNFLLQQGKSVNDVAYFIGEDAPKMTGTRQPEIPAGYSYDYINAEVILTRLTVKNGKWTLPDGTSYHVLVLPPLKTMRPEVLERLATLVQAGGTLLGPAPERSPSLEGYPQADKKVKDLAAKVWSGERYGVGRVFRSGDLADILKTLKVLPDAGLGDKALLYTHRHSATEDIYFIINQSDQPVSAPVTVRVSGRQPEWWDAVTGTTRPLPEYTASGETTTIPLRLDAYQSGFLVFRKKGSATAGQRNFPEPTAANELSGPWSVTFDPAARGPERPVSFPTLTDWSKHTDPRIRDYSGKAVYRIRFTADPSKGKAFLHLGEVRALASVKINGIPLGTVWTAPWELDISRAVKKGANEAEIEVVNTWVNRLIGDSRLPEAQRRTWSNVNPYKPESTYEPSGLLGPVRVLYYPASTFSSSK